MVGIAVETIVWSRAAISMPASSAEKIRLTRRRVRTIGGGGEVGGGGVHGDLLGRSTASRARGTGGERTAAAARWSGGSARSGQPGGQQRPRPRRRGRGVLR